MLRDMKRQEKIHKVSEKITPLIERLIGYTENIERSENMIKRVYLFLWAGFFLEVAAYLMDLYDLTDQCFIFNAPLVLFLLTAVAFGVFIWSTNYDTFNYWERKKQDLMLGILYLTLFIMEVLCKLFCSIFLPILIGIPVSSYITSSMVIDLIRICYLLGTLGPGIAIFLKLLEKINEEAAWQAIENFKIRKVIDFRKDKEFLYDLKIIRYLKTGRHYTIKQKDRQRHMLLSGVTGVGKTSSTLIPAVVQDLDQKAHNEDYVQKKLLERILSHGDIHPIKDLKGQPFDSSIFYPESEQGQDFIDALLKKAPSAGITVIAPNADFADAVYDLAVSRGFSVNRIDPIPLDPATGEKKPGFTGFNPLYISPTLSSRQKKLEIFKKSRMFSDVLQALYDQSGKSDPYFTSLNRNLTTMLAILILITYEKVHAGGQPRVTDIQEVINDFSCVRKYLLALAQIMGVDGGTTDIRLITAEWLKGREFGEYQFIVSQIACDLLGAGRTDMEKQARGLRVIINEFLTDPLIRDILCASETVDIDLCLSKGQVTVVNYALELGLSLATGFGLFFCLSFNQAVLRRPGNEDSRLPHFYYCDEMPILLHRDMEQIFTLFRQFRVSFCCAFQTFSQFDRNAETKYLKNVMLSNAGHHIVYGHCAPEEMMLYEQLAGKEIQYEEQQTVSQSSLTSSEPFMSFSTRTTAALNNVMDGYRMRNKDFQEVTVFGINNGDHIPPFDGKVSFLSKKARKGKPRCVIDWSMFVEEKKENVTFRETGISYETENDRLVAEYEAELEKLEAQVEKNPERSKNHMQTESDLDPSGEDLETPVIQESDINFL